MTPIIDTMAVVARHQQFAPVDLIKIARDLGINVYEEPMEDSISGMLSRDHIMGGRSGFAIFINKKHHSNRRRFTFAHEIAHFILHRDLIEKQIVDTTMYRSGLSDRIEIEANRLAAEILMPKKLIIRYQKANKNTREMATLFGVSEAAMRIRIETVGPLQDELPF